MAKKANGGSPAKKSAEVTKTLTTAQVEKIVGDINRLAIDTVERGQMDIDDLVLNKFFQGSLSEATSRNPYKSKSMLQIIGHVKLRVDRRRLGEWVRAAFVRKELIAKSVDCSNLSYSHFAALLRVDDEKNRKKLATDANKKQWTASKLAEEIGKKKVATVSAGTAQGPVQPPNEKAEKLLEVIGNPQALMNDEETKKLLASPQDMRHMVPLSVAMQLADSIDGLIASMKGSVNLLELAKRNISLAYIPAPQVEDAEVIDV
jgi:hypothetical protein